uniref:Uncharacterized protein n=1 Tax=Lactuca sativa TaxID=4236 RepID=A0A9R1W3G4_LACSA|nr:hypothetical protein LSAT_V11C300149370 [Lactuca sativa]
MLTKGIHDYIQWSFVERSSMASKISGAILNYLITCTRTLFDHIYFSGRFTNVLTSYAEMVLRKRMQNGKQQRSHHRSRLRSCPTFIEFLILKKLDLGIVCGHAIVASRHSNIHELANMVKIYYWADVFQNIYKTQTVHPIPPPSQWEISDPLMSILLPM